MKLGLLTAPFPRRSLEQVAAWAAGEGFEMLEVACWPAAGAERRRYAGTSHIDVTKVDPDQVRDVLDAARARDLLARLLPEQPPSGREGAARREHAPAQGDRRRRQARRPDRRHLRRARPDEERPGQLPRVPQGLARSRRPRRVEGRQDRDRELPDDLLATTSGRAARTSPPRLPPGTRCSRSSTARASGSTSTRHTSSGSMIDYERVVRDYAAKLFHVHAKDLEIDRDGLYRNGTISLGMGWQVPRLPGLGEVRWDRFVAALYRAGYDDVVSVEHEDRDVRGHRGARQARLPDRAGHAPAAAALAARSARRKCSIVSADAVGQRRARQRADEALERGRLERLGERQRLVGPRDPPGDLGHGRLDRGRDLLRSRRRRRGSSRRARRPSPPRRRGRTRSPTSGAKSYCTVPP